MIGWYVHHQGLGHATRAASVATHLRHEATGLSSAPAPQDWPGRWVSLARDDCAVDGLWGGAAEVDATAQGRLHWVPRTHPGLAQRHAAVATWCAEHRPALMVVDVSVEVALLVRLCGVPVVVVALPGVRNDPAHVLAYDIAEALLAPWPRGTHELAWPARWRDKTWFVGAIGRYDDRPFPPATRRSSLRALVLWGSGGRATSAEQVQAAYRAVPQWQWTERDPSAGCEVWEALAAADVVVTHAGQNAVAEVAAARRPAVVVAQPRPFDEQTATARTLDAMGVAVGLTAWPKAGEWPGLLDRAVALGGQGWKRWSSGHGALDAAQHIDALADELTGGGTS